MCSRFNLLCTHPPCLSSLICPFTHHPHVTLSILIPSLCFCHISFFLQSLNVSIQFLQPRLCHTKFAALSVSFPFLFLLSGLFPPLSLFSPSLLSQPPPSFLSLHHLPDNDRGDRWRPDHQYYQSASVYVCVCLFLMCVCQLHTHTHRWWTGVPAGRTVCLVMGCCCC